MESVLGSTVSGGSHLNCFPNTFLQKPIFWIREYRKRAKPDSTHLLLKITLYSFPLKRKRWVDINLFYLIWNDIILLTCVRTKWNIGKVISDAFWSSADNVRMSDVHSPLILFSLPFAQALPFITPPSQTHLSATPNIFLLICCQRQDNLCKPDRDS